MAAISSNGTPCPCKFGHGTPFITLGRFPLGFPLCNGRRPTVTIRCSAKDSSTRTSPIIKPNLVDAVSTPNPLDDASCFAEESPPSEQQVEQETEASESEYESSEEENDGSATEESSPFNVELLLKKYREALSNNDESAVKELETKFQQLAMEKASYAKQVSTLNEEIRSLKERLLRLNADFDNFRKRSERDRINISSNVKGDVVNSLLPMVDNFERAKTQIKIETEGEQRIDNSYQGIYKQFVEIMKGLGVAVIETVGKEFDPNLHEAIMREESSEYAEGVVIEEFRRGFMLGDKLLRPSMVKVSSGAPVAAAADPVVEEGASEMVKEAA